MCRVFDRLIKESEDVVLIIAGSKQDGAIFAKLETMFCDRIIYLGERSDIIDIMAKCDGLCLPSIWEGLPITLLEALYVGCVPICAPVGGIVNVIEDGQNGILSNSSEEDDYYLAMQRFLQFSEDVIKKMAEAARHSFLPYDMSITAKRYLEYYHSNE